MQEDPLGILKGSEDPLGILKKKDGGSVGQQPSQLQSAPQPELAGPTLPSVSALLKERKSLEQKKSSASLVTNRGFSNVDPFVDYDAQISEVNKKIKQQGIDPDELVKDFSEIDFDVTDDLIKSYTEKKKTKPLSAKRDIAASVWHSTVRRVIDQDEQNAPNKNAELNKLIQDGANLPKSDFNTALNYGVNALAKINEFTAGDGDARSKAIANFRKDYLPVLGNVLIKDKAALSNFKNAPVDLALLVGDMFDKGYADQTRQLIDTEFTSGPAQKAKERRLVDVENAGLSIISDAIAQEYENNSDNIKGLNEWTNTNLPRLKEIGNKIASLDPTAKSKIDSLSKQIQQKIDQDNPKKAELDQQFQIAEQSKKQFEADQSQRSYDIYTGEIDKYNLMLQERPPSDVNNLIQELNNTIASSGLSQQEANEYNTLINEYNNLASKSSKIGNLPSWAKYIEDKKKSQFNRYPATKMDMLMEAEQEWDGTKANTAGRFISNVGSLVDKTGDALDIMYNSIFLDPKQALEKQFEQVGLREDERRILNYEPDKETLYEKPMVYVFGNEIKGRLEAIRNSNLSEDQKRKATSDEISKGIDSGEVYQTTNLNAGKLNLTASSVLNTFATVGPQLVTSIGTAMATGGGTAGLTLSVFSNAFSSYYDDAVNKGNANPVQYALAHTLVEAATESLGTTNLKTIKKAFEGKKGFGANFFKNLTEEEMKALSAGSKGAFRNIKGAAATGIKSTGEESFEELLAAVGGNVVDNELFGENKPITEGAVESFVTMSVGGLPMSLLGIPLTVRTTDIGKKFALYNAASDSQKTLALLNEEYKAGNITEEQYKERVSLVNEYATAISQTPRVDKNGNPLKDDQRVKYAFNRFIANKAKSSKEDIPTEQMADINESVSKSESENNKIITNATTESSKPVQEGAAESNIGEPTGVVQGQREGGTGEGIQGEATLPKADVGDSNLGSKEIEDRKAEIEARRSSELNTATSAGYGVIAADYLFTGGRESMLSTDYLLQALTSAFPFAGKKIDEIRNRYASRLGNISEDINRDEYRAAMEEIRSAIDSTYNNKRVSEIYDTILQNARGFNAREGNQISAELESINDSYEKGVNAKYDAEIAALQPTQKEIAPGKKLFNEPVPEVAVVEAEFKKSKGINTPEPAPITKLDEEKSKTIADAYDALVDSPNDPEVQSAYQAMADETMEQFDAIDKAGVKVEIWTGKGEPYKNSGEMIADVRDNKHMYIFSTEEGFGDTPITDEQRQQNALLRDSGIKDVNGKPLLINDIFRFVHDYFGHSRLGNSFGAIGEENAWNVHARMYSPLARRAMTTETRGQNSWVNFNKNFRNPDGTMKKKGDEGYVPPAQRPFAEQKMALLPEEFSQIEDAYSVKPTVAEELTQELIKDPVAKVQQSLKSAGITVDLIADPAEFDRQVQQLGGQAGMEGVFLADDGRVLLNEQKLKEGTNAGRIIFHEATHPIINIIRNTNPELYKRVVAGINAASDNPAIQQAKVWVESNKNVYDTDIKKEDETLVETIAMVGDGTLDLNTIETGFKQALIEVINTIARALGFKPVLNDTDVAAFKKLAAQIADVLTSGRDIAEVVGRENVKEYGVPVGIPTQPKAPEKYGTKVKHDGGQYKLSFVKPSDIIDIKSLVEDIVSNKQKVWFWTADQLGRGMYFDNVVNGEHYLDAGPSFALDPKNRDKGVIWATGKGKKWVEDKIANSDYIFIMSGSPQKSKLFNKRVAEITFNRVKKAVGEEGAWDKFKSEVLSVSKIGKINEILNKYNSFEDLLASPDRKELLIQFDAQKEKKSTPLKGLLDKYGVLMDYNDLRDGFYRENGFELNDIMLVLKPTGFGGNSEHSTYENDILGEVVGVPDRKVNSYDLMTDEFKKKYTEGMSRTEQSQAVAPYGVGIRDIQASAGNRKNIGSVEVLKTENTFNNLPVSSVSGTVYHRTNSSVNDIINNGFAIPNQGRAKYGYGVYFNLEPKQTSFGANEIAADISGLNLIDLTDISDLDQVDEFNNAVSGDVIDYNKVTQDIKNAGIDGVISGSEVVIFNNSKLNNVRQSNIQASAGNRLAPNGKPSNLTEKQYQQVRTPEFKNWFGDWENDPANASKVVDENGEPLVVYHGSRSMVDFAFSEFNVPAEGVFFTSDYRTATWFSQGRLYNKLFFEEVKIPNNLNEGSSLEDLVNYYKDNLDPTARIEKVVINDENRTLTYRFNKDYDNESSPLGSDINEAQKKLYKIVLRDIKNVNESSSYPFYEVFLNIRKPHKINAKGNPFYKTPFEGKEYSAVSVSAEIKNRGKNDGLIIKNTIEGTDDNFQRKSDSYIAFEPNQIKSATENVGTFSTEDARIQFSAGNRPENNQNFKLAAFVMRKKAEGATDGEIAIGIASVTGMKPEDIKTIIDNPEQFIRDSFPSMSKLQQDNLIQKAKIQDIYRARQFGKPIDKPFMGLEVPQEMVDDYLDKTGRADKTVKDWAKDFKRKWLDPAKGLPDWTLAIKDFATGAKNIEIARAANTIQRLKDVAKEIGFKDWEAFSDALVMAKDVQRFIPNESGITPFDAYRAAANRTFATPDDQLPALVPDAIKKLPDEIIPFVYAMRGQIDNLTRDLIGSGYVTPEQAVVLEKNLGAYTNRAYKMFSERGYVPEKKVYNAAVKFLAEKKMPAIANDNVGVLTDKQIVEKAMEEAKKDVEAILSKKKNPYFGSKSDRRDTGILQERQDIPEPIRDLMGQYTDPGTVFIMTVAKQAALKSASQYLNKLRTMGMGTLFFEREDPSRPLEYSVEIAAKGTESMNPLGGLYTTKEVAEALDMVDPTYNDLTETWMKLVGMVRWGKTVGSVATQFKNFESNGGFAVLNGYMLSGENTQAFKAAAKYVKGQYSKGEIDAITDKVIRLNLVGQSVGMRELKEMLGSGDVHDIAVDIALNPEGKWGKKVAKRVDVLGAANKLYRLGDDFWKVYAYMVEREQISDARFNGAKYDSLTKQQQEQVDIESSERVKNTWPTYDRVVEGAKFVSKRAPVFGNFISFRAESLRVLANSIKLAKQDLSDPQMRHLGVRRMAGITAYIGLRSAITIGLAKMAGFAAAGIAGAIFGDDEEERNKRAIKEALPTFMRTGDLAVVQGDKPHQYTVVDMSSLDPYGVVPNSLNAFTEGREGIFGRTMEPGVLAAGTELFSGFLEPEMTFQTMWSVINNKDPKTGEQLVMETDTDLQASAKVAAKIWDQLEPSTVAMIQRLYERENKSAELLALGGARPYDVDLHKSFGFILSRFGKDIDAINKEYNRIKYNDKMTEQEKEAAEKVAEDKKAFAISKVSQIYRDFINIGADPKVLDELINQKSAVKVTGYDKNTKKSIKTGKISKEKLFK